MKVLFDVTSLLPKHLSFEGTYVRNLFRLLKGLGIDIDPVYKMPRGVKENFIDQHIGHSSKKFYGMFAAKNAILHGPSVNLLSESPKFKKIISINDMSMYRDGLMDEGFAVQLQNHLKEQLQKGPEAIIVPTQEVHNEVLIRFPKFVGKVHVITPGCDHILDSSSLGVHKITENPYFLFAGTIDKRSNVSGIVKAFHGLAQVQEDLHLVIIGNNGYGSESVHKLIESSSMRDRIKVVGYKSISQRKRIYTDAIATLAPSLYEGFNYSIVEAMKMGCPVMTSGLGAMEEIGRGAAHLVNPKDPEQIMAGMERLRLDKSYRNKMIKAGEETTQKMTWLRCARETADIYNQILK